MKIAYKIISALLAIAVLPAMVFSPLIYYYVSSFALQALFTVAELMDSKVIADKLEQFGLESAPEGIADSLSLFDIFQTTDKLKNVFEGGELNEELASVAPAFFSSIFAFILIAVCAIVTAVLAFKAKDNKSVIVSSAFGIGASVLFETIFNDMVSSFLNGRISIADFVDSFVGALLADVEVISLTSTFWFIPGLFACVILWTLVYNFTLPENEKAKKKMK